MRIGVFLFAHCLAQAWNDVRAPLHTSENAVSGRYIVVLQPDLSESEVSNNQLISLDHATRSVDPIARTFLVSF